MKQLLITLGILLFILHQDCWWWDDKTLIFGFLPIGLAYHALFSLLAAGLWALMVKFAWPGAWEAWAEEKGHEDNVEDASS